MGDWREKLAALGRQLEAEERAETERKAAALKAFRTRLEVLSQVVEEARLFADAFGVDMTCRIGRFDERYPYLELSIRKPALEYRVECRDGAIWERLKEGDARATEAQVSLETMSKRAFGERVTGWVRAAAEANRKVPGRRR